MCLRRRHRCGGFFFRRLHGWRRLVRYGRRIHDCHLGRGRLYLPDFFSARPRRNAHRRPRIPDLVCELVDQDAVAERGLADVRAVAAVYGESVAVLVHDLDGTLRRARFPGQQDTEPGRMWAADGDAGAQPRAGEVRDALVRDDASRLQGDHAVSRPRRFLGVVGGEEHRAAERRVGPQDAVQPLALARREAARGPVEDERVRIREKRAGEAEAPVHASRERAEPLLPQADDADDFEDLVRTLHRHACGRAQHTQLSAYGAGRMPLDLAEQHADFSGGMGDAVQGAASEMRDSTALLEFEHQPDRRRLAGRAGAEQRRDATRRRLEGHVVDSGRELLAGIAGQSEGLDHRFSRRMCDRSAAGARPPSGDGRTPWVPKKDNATFPTFRSGWSPGCPLRGAGGRSPEVRPGQLRVTPRGAASAG